MNRLRDKTVNIKTTHIEYGPTIGDMRMSRLSHPRASLVAMALLAVVFLLFGMFASAIEPSYSPAPNTINGAASLIGDWVLSHVGFTV
ncbi:MAG: hypothetical protein EP301_11020 [Gammaproteobacteria bacterium]|jgi:hypothetical protein|nr:MAG: hypothetical protein EP301_11020 [Gammaproteobacteria bacterium]